MIFFNPHKTKYIIYLKLNIPEKRSKSAPPHLVVYTNQQCNGAYAKAGIFKGHN